VRGGRGGRSRGRFSGRGSAAQDLIRDNLEDLGIEGTYQSQHDFRIPPPLYPTIEIPAPTALNEISMFYVQKSYDLAKR